MTPIGIAISLWSYAVMGILSVVTLITVRSELYSSNDYTCCSYCFYYEIGIYPYVVVLYKDDEAY